MAAEADIDEAEPAAPKRRPGRKLLFVGLGALIALGGGFAAYSFLLAPDAAPEAARAAVPATFIFNLPPMVVNLKSEGPTEEFLRLTVALEVANEGVMTEIQPRMARVVDAFQVYLRELRKSDLDGSAGVYRLREELRRRVNVAIYPSQVDSILFREILVQ
ncbi:flagellar basal body-associated protein FliL [Arsenicitalea aurantiaca]|uniref:Flagellar protein FliL n=1 Tax=Arsenicitalea aurantiaca TaxID=1783274 RepID=A0A433XGI1_9HYPH|nr:flagellar basal body-associated FliL family protein [Arsenicitalea aurantiaca]RUT33124.1 flagellar basal body-associated protein FliL [Arsenicitalea aurantiaca]